MARVMNSAPLPREIDVVRLASKGAELTGSLNLASMQRLTEVAGEQQGGIALQIKFGKDEEGLNYLVCAGQASLKLVCQRCLQPMDFALTVNSVLSPIADEKQAESLPKRYEPLMVTDEKVTLRDMVEDECLLQLPQVPKHNASECPVDLSGALKRQKETEKQTNPFDVLKKPN